MNIQVTCHAGYPGEETPKSFRLGDRKIEIVEILDRWAGPGHRYFKVTDADKALYILQHNTASWTWQITFYQDSACRNRFENGHAEFMDDAFGDKRKDFSIH